LITKKPQEKKTKKINNFLLFSHIFSETKHEVTYVCTTTKHQYLPESEAASSLSLGSTELLERDEDLGDLTELRLENMEMTAVGDDVSGEETKCFRVASPAGEEEEDLDLTAERNMELRALALEAGIWGLWEGAPGVGGGGFVFPSSL
jgi:hypothetical protein